MVAIARVVVVFGLFCVGGCSDRTADACSGPLCCDGRLADLYTDDEHCGECGNKCDTEAGYICSTGKCSCTGIMTDCDGTCVNTNTDPRNCGECDKDCGDLPCNGGNCGCEEGDKTCCNGAAMDALADNNNCGDCGVVCDVDKGFSCCNGDCVDTLTSLDHCGGCDMLCDDTRAGGDPICMDGDCIHDCGPPPRACCGGAVVDTSSDPNNCGACGNSCDTANTGLVCINSQCGCPGSFTDCGGQCVDLQTNGNHCNECGCKCHGGGACLAGKCLPDCDGSLSVCWAAYCADDTCSANCPIQCVDTDTNPNNCGNCGIKCLSGSCSGGQCQGDAGVVYPDAGADAAVDGGTGG